MLSDRLYDIAQQSHIEGMERGRTEGKKEGMYAVLMRRASRRWGDLFQAFETSFRNMKGTYILEKLSIALFTATSLRDFEASLAAYADGMHRQ